MLPLPPGKDTFLKLIELENYPHEVRGQAPGGLHIPYSLVVLADDPTFQKIPYIPAILEQQWSWSPEVLAWEHQRTLRYSYGD